MIGHYPIARPASPRRETAVFQPKQFPSHDSKTLEDSNLTGKLSYRALLIEKVIGITPALGRSLTKHRHYAY
jgi:hypothetical protein